MSKGKLNRGWKKFDFDANTSIDNPIVKSLSTNLEDAPIIRKDFNFELKIEPKNVQDLSVHSKKIEEVKTWLQVNILNGSSMKYGRLLLLTGPAGSGKTVTVKNLCKSLNIDLSEWINPVDKDYDLFHGPGQTEQLLEFLSQSKYPSLLSLNKPKVTLIEDFPNTVIRKPEEFITVLEKCWDAKLCIVFICTETSSSSMNLGRKLFPEEVRSRFSIANISFNPCSATVLKQGLKRAHKIIKDNVDIFKIPSQDVIDGIIASSMGDIRCAVNQFYFASLKGTSDLMPETLSQSKKLGTKRKRKVQNQFQIKSMMRDESLGLFHSLGRVLNPKKIVKDNSWRLQADLEALIDDLSVQPSTFCSFLHENYTKYFGDIEDAAKAADVLSLSEILLQNWSERQENLQYGLWVSILGVMVYNQHRLSKFIPIHAPKKYNNVIKHDGNYLSISDGYYSNIINKSNSYHTFKF